MTVEYRVDFDDTSGSTIESFGNFDGLDFEIVASGKGSYKLDLSGYDSRIGVIGDDYIMRVWMQDPAFGIPWTEVFAGIHKTFVDSMAENGRLSWESYGPSCEEILDKELIAYPAGDSSLATKSGAASTVMRAYVQENAGSLATVANGRDYDGVNPLLLGADLGVGGTWSGSRPRKHLLGTLQQIQQFSVQQGDQVDFRMSYAGGYQFLFEAGYLGADRTAPAVSGGLNAAGHVPVVLSPKYGNVRSFSRSRSRYNEANLILALGQGSEGARAFAVAEDTASTGASPIAQRVTPASATSETTPAGLLAAAQGRLYQSAARDKFMIQPYKSRANRALLRAFPDLDTANFTGEVLWRDYFPGDFVTVEDFRTGTRQDVQIVKVRVRIRPSDKRVEAVNFEVRNV